MRAAMLSVLALSAALAASSFIYIAVADLIPGLHRAMDSRSTAWQIALIALGIATVAAPAAFLNH